MQIKLIQYEFTVDGTAAFTGDVHDVDDAVEAMSAIKDSIFQALSQHLDCSRLNIGGMTWDEYQARRLSQVAKEVV